MSPPTTSPSLVSHPWSIGSRTEKPAPDPHDGGTLLDGDLEVAGHAHRELAQSVSFGHLAQGPERRARPLRRPRRADRHQAADVETEVAQAVDEGGQHGRRAAALLLLVGGVD